MVIQAATRCQGREGDTLHQLRGPWKQEPLLIEITAKPSFLDQLCMSIQREILEEGDATTYVHSVHISRRSEIRLHQEFKSTQG